MTGGMLGAWRPRSAPSGRGGGSSIGRQRPFSSRRGGTEGSASTNETRWTRNGGKPLEFTSGTGNRHKEGQRGWNERPWNNMPRTPSITEHALELAKKALEHAKNLSPDTKDQEKKRKPEQDRERFTEEPAVDTVEELEVEHEEKRDDTGLDVLDPFTNPW